MTETITIRFVFHRGIFGWLCRIAQYGDWATHCEAVLDDGRRLGSWFLKGGVRIVGAAYDAGEFTLQEFIEISVTAEQKAKYLAFLERQVGKPYDWRSIVSFYFNSERDWQEPDSWFCDELIAAALVACGRFPDRLAVKLNRLTVRDVKLLALLLKEAS